MGVPRLQPLKRRLAPQGAHLGGCAQELLRQVALPAGLQGRGGQAQRLRQVRLHTQVAHQKDDGARKLLVGRPRAPLLAPQDPGAGQAAHAQGSAQRQERRQPDAQGSAAAQESKGQGEQEEIAPAQRQAGRTQALLQAGCGHGHELRLLAGDALPLAHALRAQGAGAQDEGVAGDQDDEGDQDGGRQWRWHGYLPLLNSPTCCQAVEVGSKR